MFLLYNISNLWHTLKTKDDDILTNNGNEENNHVFKYQTVKNKDRANKMQFVNQEQGNYEPILPQKVLCASVKVKKVSPN